MNDVEVQARLKDALTELAEATPLANPDRPRFGDDRSRSVTCRSGESADQLVPSGTSGRPPTVRRGSTSRCWPSLPASSSRRRNLLRESTAHPRSLVTDDPHHRPRPQTVTVPNFVGAGLPSLDREARAAGVTMHFDFVRSPRPAASGDLAVPVSRKSARSGRGRDTRHLQRGRTPTCGRSYRGGARCRRPYRLSGAAGPPICRPDQLDGQSRPLRIRRKRGSGDSASAGRRIQGPSGFAGVASRSPAPEGGWGIRSRRRPTEWHTGRRVARHGGPICPECKQSLRENLVHQQVESTGDATGAQPAVCDPGWRSSTADPVGTPSTSALRRRSSRRQPERRSRRHPRRRASLGGRFQNRCRELIGQIRSLGFDPFVWVGLINEVGAVAAAKAILTDYGVLPVTQWLVGQSRPELTLECEIQQARWADLFDERDRRQGCPTLGVDRRVTVAGLRVRRRVFGRAGVRGFPG